MKNASRLFLAAAAAAGALHAASNPAQAAPFLAIGDNAELFLTGASAIRYEDNIFLATTDEKSDTLLSVTPGVEVVLGKGSAITGNFYLREEMLAYSDNESLNTTLTNLGTKTKYDNGKTKLSLDATYAQIAQNSSDVRLTDQIVRRSVSHVLGLSEVGITEKTSFAAGIGYDRTNYGPKDYTDQVSMSIPMDYYFGYSEKLSLSAGYRYRENWLSGSAIDNDDHFFSVGARGEFTPKMTGQIRVGYTRRTYETVNDDQNLFGMEGNLTFASSEKTSYQITLANDFGNSGMGDSTKNLSLGIAANSKLTDQWSIDAGLDYRNTKYTVREDDFYVARIGVGYAWNAYAKISASWTYNDNRSDLSASEFTDNVFSIGVAIRY